MDSNSKIKIGDKCLVEEADIYLYFEIIRQLNPKSVIDIGMFLRRIGAISRQVMGVEIENTVKLDAINIFDNKGPNVYSVIYNNIYDKNDLDEKKSDYELGLMIRVKDFVSEEYFDKLIEWCLGNTNQFVVEEMSDIIKYGIESEKVQTLTLDNETFYLISC